MTAQEKLKLDSTTLAEVIHSSAITLGYNSKGSKSYNQREPHEMLPKVISFNLVGEDDIIAIGDKSVFDVKNDKITKEYDSTLTVIENRIKEVIGDGDIEFIKQDPVTKSVLVLTQAYVDKLVSGEIPIGTLVLNYFKQWYIGKCGPGGKGTQEHHEKFRTFSQREIEMLRHMYIPIAVISKYMKPVYDSVLNAIEVSPLAEFVETDISYSVTGGRVEGGQTIWIPRIVAKEYLEESNDFKVLSYTILHKLIKDAGLLGHPPVTNHKVISTTMFSKTDVQDVTDEFILNSRQKKDRIDVTDKDTIQQFISYDKDTTDNLIPDDVGDINLDY